MTLAPAHPGRRSVAAGSEVFAAGSSVARRRMWVALGCGTLMVAYLDWLVGEISPILSVFTLPSATLIGVAGAAVLAAGLWRRARSHEVRAAGILLVCGGSVFGDRQLIPWGSITRFGGRQVGPDEVCLYFCQQHIAGEQVLPGAPLSVEEYDRMIDRLRVVLVNRFPQLELGGLRD